MNEFPKTLTVARLPKRLAHAPIFFSVDKKAPVTPLDVTYVSGKETPVTMHFAGPERLGASDLRVLLGLSALAGWHASAGCGIRQMLHLGYQARRGLQLTGDAAKEKALAIPLPLRQFVTRIGYRSAGGAITNQVLLTLQRLASVTVHETYAGYCGSYRLISLREHPHEPRTLLVGLNPRLRTVLPRQKNYVQLDCHKAFAARSDAALLLLARLTWINTGSMRKIGLSTLCGYVYDGEAPSRGAEHHRRRTVRKALGELTELGWRVTMESGQTFQILRPTPPQLAPVNSLTNFCRNTEQWPSEHCLPLAPADHTPASAQGVKPAVSAHAVYN